TNSPFSVSGFSVGSAGPFEFGTVTYITTSNTNPSLFSTPPAIGTNGTLTYTVAANQTGSANITVKANDGLLDSVSTSTFTITVVAPGALTPIVPNRTYTTLPQMQLTVSAFADGLLAGITDPTPAAGTPLVVKSFAGTDSGATFAYYPDTATGQPNGTFTYTPAPHFVGSDSMTYTVCDGTAANAKCTTANLTITMSGPVLYFVDDNAAVGGDGSLLKPWKRLDAASNSRVEGATIFVLSGTYTGETGLMLKKNETVIGQGVAGASFDAFFGITPPTTGSLPPRPPLNGAGITTPVVQLDTVSTRTAFHIERLYSVVQGPTTDRVRNFVITGGNALNWQVALPTNVVTFEDIQVTGGGITIGAYGTATIKNVAMTNGRVQAYYMDGVSVSFQNVDINNSDGTMALEANWSRNGSMVFDAASSIQVTNTPQQALMIMDSRPTVSFQFACPITLSGGRDVLFITGDTIDLTGGPNVTFTNTVSSTVSDTTRWAMYTSIVNLSMSAPSPSTFTGGRGVHLDRVVATGTGVALGSIFASTSLFTDTSGQPITVTGGTINSNNGSPSQPCFTIVNAPNVAVSGVTGVNCTP
ncbi:MAG TPA: Ig-like domain-containing protein, partial [Thermoanaerobaculia bacterium]